MTEFEIFSQALDIDEPDKRTRFLNQICGGNAALRQRVENLIRSHGHCDFMQEPAEGLTGIFRPDVPRPIGHAAGSCIGPYRLGHRIGEGGMGVVYEAVQAGLNRTVAVKMLRNCVGATDEEIQRFRLEAEAIAHLDHPNIVPVYDVGQHDGVNYFSMKLVEGSATFADFLAREPADPRIVAELLAKVADAVNYAHQRGIMHRDLKPSNILLDPDRRPYVTDFGLAKRVSGESRLTESGAVIGTPSYMAPEQVLGRGALTTAIDVYALGAILYEALTGQPPFRAETPMATLLQVVDRDLQRPRAIKPSVDPDLEAVCLKCLERDPQKRYASAAELATDLQHWLSGEPLTVRPIGLPTLLRIWVRQNFGSGAWLVFLGVVGGVFVGGLGLLLTTRPWGLSAGSINTLVQIGVCIGASVGLIVVATVRPRNAVADLVAGLTAGTVGAVIAYTISWGWAAVNMAGVPYGIWLGMLGVQVGALMCVAGTLIAGRLLRREHSVRRMAWPYFEVAIPATLLIYLPVPIAFSFAYLGHGRHEYYLAVLPFLVLAVTASLRQWSKPIRMALHVAWLAAMLACILWANNWN